MADSDVLMVRLGLRTLSHVYDADLLACKATGDRVGEVYYATRIERVRLAQGWFEGVHSEHAHLRDMLNKAESKNRRLEGENTRLEAEAATQVAATKVRGTRKKKRKAR